MRLLLFVAGALALTACQPSAPPSNATTPAPPAPPIAPITDPEKPLPPEHDHFFSPAINAGDLGELIRRLSSDDFEGRKPGTLGERVTTAYLQEQFVRLGLKPGNKGSFFQNVPMQETVLLDPAGTRLHVATQSGVEDFAFASQAAFGTLQGRPEVIIKDSPLMFLGYGIDAADEQWNDYAGVDVKGKTVVVLVNDPGWGNHDPNLFKGPVMTYYGRWVYKFEEAARQGAAGCLVVHDADAAGYPWEVVVAGWNGSRFDLPIGEDPEPRLQLAGWLTTASAQRLFASAGFDFDTLKRSADLRGFKPTVLNARLSTTLRTQVRNSTSDNVLALLPGSERSDEAIVYSAHWDHLGVNPDNGQNDHTYNGAIDNASGVAALLEIAEAFSHQKDKPARSVLFLVPTLEEFGLLGSRYYTAHPVVPLAKTVAAINMDMFLANGRSHDMTVIGSGKSDLDEYLKVATQTQGRSVSADESPEKGYFYRSDQLNFARQGVPALYARSGFDLLQGGRDAGHAAYDSYTRDRYHKPGDQYEASMDLSGMVEDVQALYLVGQRLAAEPIYPQWNKGSEFHAVPEHSANAAAPTPSVK